MMEPRMGSPSPRTIDNYVSRACYTLVPLDARFVRPTAASEIAERCNERLIYEMLFARMMNGRSYSEQDAEGFMSWAREGWSKATHFVFLLLAPDGKVAGAIDIKSTNVASAEIGYWLGREHSGVMTNAVSAVVEIAAGAGYRKLHAWVQDSNARSIAVLKRAGFRVVGHGGRVGEFLTRFERASDETAS